MPIVNWNVNLIVGVPEIDKYHEHLVGLLNELYDNFREGVDVPQSAIDEIAGSSVDHFTYEETLMSENSYPGLAQHRDEHVIFSRRIMEIRRSHQQNQRVSVELLWFLCNWVTHHIRGTHADLGQFLDGMCLRTCLYKDRR